LPSSASIAGRPAVVDRRSRYGDREGDTIVAAQRRGGAVTSVARKSGSLLLGKVPNLQAATVRQAPQLQPCFSSFSRRVSGVKGLTR
jgi:IS30 family transposase